MSYRDSLKLQNVRAECERLRDKLANVFASNVYLERAEKEIQRLFAENNKLRAENEGLRAKVYILSNYEEHGAYNVVATLDRDRIIPLIRERFTNQKNTINKTAETEEVAEAVATATELLKNPDPEGSGMCDLNRAWGGIMLHVVNLS